MRQQLIDLLLSTKRSNRIKNNVFGTNHKRHVLISYNVNHFLIKNTAHTNYYESHIIAKYFFNLNYNVDVVSFDNRRKIDFIKYDIIFGFGIPFEKSFSSKKKIKRIHYATGAHVCYQNSAEIARILEVNERKSASLTPKRIIEWTWSQSSSMSDAIIMIGNEWTKQTYISYTSSPIYPINATSLFQNFHLTIKREISLAKKHFLWFGSGGLVHKGLDLCLDFFSKNPSLHLHICGPKEEDFFEIFQHELNLDNIHIHGFIDVNSQAFIDIVTQCMFSIMPTCSEGQSTSLLTTMAAGLIPLATVQSGKKLDKLGYLIEGLNEKSIAACIENVMLLKDDELYALSQANQTEINNLHTINTFEHQFNSIMSHL